MSAAVLAAALVAREAVGPLLTPADIVQRLDDPAELEAVAENSHATEAARAAARVRLGEIGQ
jgi:hypothetical protein